jgi:uncharacterized protein (DUF111 family)
MRRVNPEGLIETVSALIEPMRILSLDCPSEFTGESLVGALADLGVSPSTFEWELNGIEIGDHHLHFDRQEIQGVHAVRFGVHGGLLHVDHPHSAGHHHDPVHREDDHITYAKLRTQIETAKFSDFVKSHSLGVLRRIAIAKSELSSVEIDQIEFPETEGLEWLLATILSCIGLEQLQVRQIFIQQTSPRPSPGRLASHRVLSGALLSQFTAEHLEASPIGAAILAEFAATVGAPPPLKSARTSYGLSPEGGLGRLSLLQATLGEIGDGNR